MGQRLAHHPRGVRRLAHRTSLPNHGRRLHHAAPIGIDVWTQIRVMGLSVVAEGAGLVFGVCSADGLVGVVSLPGGLD
jgi:hypothetical protein